MNQVDKFGHDYQSILDRHQRKRQGIHYTRYTDARKITKETLEKIKIPITKVLEPSVGGGAFAVAIYDQLKEMGYDGKTIIDDILYCIDLDEDALKITEKILKDLEPESKPNLIKGNALYQIEKYGPYSVILGNPPYVRPHNIDKSDKESYRKKFSCYKGLSDLSIAFIQAGYDNLEPGGYLGFIITNAFARARYGSLIRKYIGEGVVIYDERNATDKFDASVSVVDLVITRGNHNGIWYNGEFKKDLKLGETEWNFKEKLEIEGTTLKDLGIKLKLGIVTGHNKLLIRDWGAYDWAKPVLRGKDKFLTKNKIPIFTAHKEEDIPKTFISSLSSDEIKELKEKTKGKRKWWELQSYSPNIKWSEKKWVIRRVGGSFKDFIKIDQDVYCLDSCYVLDGPDNIDLDKLVEYLKTNRQINDQAELIMNKIGDKFEIHTNKFLRLIIPKKDLDKIKK